MMLFILLRIRTSFFFFLRVTFKINSKKIIE